MCEFTWAYAMEDLKKILFIEKLIFFIKKAHSITTIITAKKINIRTKLKLKNKNKILNGETTNGSISIKHDMYI